MCDYNNQCNYTGCSQLKTTQLDKLNFPIIKNTWQLRRTYRNNIGHVKWIIWKKSIWHQYFLYNSTMSPSFQNWNSNLEINEDWNAYALGLLIQQKYLYSTFYKVHLPNMKNKSYAAIVIIFAKIYRLTNNFL